jgi:phosphoglycerate dehydrogenase-like enzyme
MISEDDLAPLRDRSDVDYHEVATISETNLANLCANYDYLMLNYDVIHKLSEEFYTHQSVRQLKAIAADITGMDWASPHAAAQNNVLLLNIPHYSTESVAETTLAEVLLHTRQRHSAYVDEIKGREIQARKGINLVNRTAGVVGLGSIGTRVAELLSGVGMNVIAWNRSPRPDHQLVTLEELFATARVICICLKTVTSGPDANVKIIGDSLLELCNDTVIINLANVNLVDHEALVRNINQGKVAAYSIERSPQLLASPLGSMDAVHMPPSNSWSSDESMDALRKSWVDNVLAAIDGKLQNVYVD